MKPEDLAELHAIYQLKYRYVRGLDTHDWPLVASCFTGDARVWYNDGKFSKEGRETIIGFLSEMLDESFYSSHIVLHPEIELIDANNAKGIWRLEDIVHFSGPNSFFGNPPVKGGEEMTGAGYYYDDYVRLSGEWKIASMGYARLFEVIDRPDARSQREVDLNPRRGVPATG